MTQRELASRLEVSEKHLNRLINGHVSISTDFAMKLELVTGYSSEFWLTNQARFDARKVEFEVSAEEIEIVKTLLPGPVVARLRRAGILSTNWKKPQDLVQEIFSRAQVAGAESFRALCHSGPRVAYRQSEAYRIRSGEQWAWLEIVKERASLVQDIPAYEPQRLVDAIPALRAATLEEPADFVARATQIFWNAGVIFLAEPDISGARINGASFDVSGNPVIAVTDKQKREDVFWFTVFHEVAHVLEGDHKIGSLDLGRDDIDKSDRERQADMWASETLLPQSDLAALSAPFSVESVENFAHSLGVSPGIVAGRLKYLGKVGQSWGRGVTRRFEIV